MEEKVLKETAAYKLHTTYNSPLAKGVIQHGRNIGWTSQQILDHLDSLFSNPKQK